MANTRALVGRRKAVRNVRKITRTMELIATARFKKAMDRATEAEPFTRKIAELAADLSATATDVTHPLLQKHEEERNTVLLVLCSNRGLCGGYNAMILREAMGRIREAHGQTTLHLEVSGKRAINFFRFHGIPAEQTYTHFEDKPTFHEVEVLANRYIAGFTSGAIDRVDVAYTKFINAARQTPVIETLLPLSAVATEETPQKNGSPRRGFSVLVDEGGEKVWAIRDVTFDEALDYLARRNDQDLSAEIHSPSEVLWALDIVNFRRYWTKRAPKVDYEFLPGAADILQELLPVSFKVRLFKCFLDAAVSEQIARRVTMKQATENADEMIKYLTRQYNRARQAQITKEIAEVIGGAAALE
jgi:F-type H+-transporting ATPase subunit gamma